MLQVISNGDKKYSLKGLNEINEKLFHTDWVRLNENTYHLICEKQSFTIEVIEANYEEKCFVLKINGQLVKVNAVDEYDQLLKSMGMDTASATKVSEIKAPMPGMVIDIIAKEGDVVGKGDSLLILEAMKMENILKSSGDGSIKQIKIKKGDKVEKNQVLITFS